MADEFKPSVVEKFFNIGAGAGKKVVQAKNLVAFVEQSFTQMGTQKA